MTLTDCRNCREIGETNCPELRIHDSAFFQGQCVVAKCEMIAVENDLIEPGPNSSLYCNKQDYTCNITVKLFIACC